MRLLAVVHEADSGPALLGDAARNRGIEVVEMTAGPQSVPIPTSIDGFDLLLVLGASPSVNDVGIAPWFDREIALIRDADAHNVPILGVCFGAQALAVALGGSVARATEPEIGWFEVNTTDPDLVEPGPWLEWHVDAITPPPGATTIATTKTCVQAYTVGPHVAVQFHPEVTDGNVTSWCAGDAKTVARLGLDGPGIVERTRIEVPEATLRAQRLFDRFLRRAQAHTTSSKT